MLIEVIDSGEGIPDDQLPYIWDRYYGVDKTDRRAAAGTGLGLSIVKGFLGLHHAQYGVNNNPDKGTIFWFKLPMAKQGGHMPIDLDGKTDPSEYELS